VARIRARRNEGVYELLRSSIDITDVLDGAVGEKVDCVFHEDGDTPNMHVYDDHVYCFSYGGNGDVTKVWKAKHGFASMWEAAQDLSRKFGVELPEVSPEARARYEERRRKEDEHARIAAERHATLKDLDNPVGRKVQRYLTEERRITDEIRDRFLLGATPDGDLNIPFWVGTQIHGQVIRRLEGRMPKYVAPTNEEFPFGRRPILMQGGPKPQSYLIVEGYLDMPAAAVLGIPSIGTGAATLSKEQIADLRELGEKGATFYVLPDGDEAGSAAARRNTERLYPYAYMTPAIPAPGVKDVSDLHKADPENAARILKDLMSEGRDAVEIALSELPGRPVARVRHLKDKIVPLILQLEGREERAAVAKEVAKADGLNKEIVDGALVEQEAIRVVTNVEEAEEEIPREKWEHLLRPGVLERYRDAVCRRQGVVGDVDRQVVETVTLCMVGAQLALLPTGKPVGSSMALLGPSGRGKNFLCDAAVSFAPEEWYKAFTVASGQAFYWAAKIDPAFLKHVFIYPNEVEAIDAVIEFLRPMLSQGRAEKYVTNKDDNGSFNFEKIHVEGPMTGVLPTVRNKLEGQLQTRLLITELTDYEGRIGEQTQALSRQYPRKRAAEDSEEERKLWQAALRSLTGRREVVWFCADHPEFRLDNDGLEHGARLWGNLLGLGAANAFLEQENRTIETLEDGTELIVADDRDYRIAYELLAATSKRSMENISPTHRKILNAVHELQESHAYGGHSMRKIAEKAGVSASTVHRNEAFLTKSLRYLEKDWQDGGLRLALGVDPSWWEEGEPMKGFPKPAAVESWEGAHAARGGTPRNSGTLPPNADMYAEKLVPAGRNGRGTRGTPQLDDVEVF
jgi:hypothetical protein